MCRIQYGDEIPNELADGEVLIIPKPSGSGPDFMHVTNLLDSTARSSLATGFLMYWTDTDIGSSVSLMGFRNVWRSDMQSGSVLAGQAGALVNNSVML